MPQVGAKMPAPPLQHSLSEPLPGDLPTAGRGGRSVSPRRGAVNNSICLYGSVILDQFPSFGLKNSKVKAEDSPEVSEPGDKDTTRFEKSGASIFAHDKGGSSYRGAGNRPSISNQEEALISTAKRALSISGGSTPGSTNQTDASDKFGEATQRSNSILGEDRSMGATRIVIPERRPVADAGGGRPSRPRTASFRSSASPSAPVAPSNQKDVELHSFGTELSDSLYGVVFDELNEEDSNEKCHECEERPSHARCFDCGLTYCSVCNTRAHSRGKLVHHTSKRIHDTATTICNPACSACMSIAVSPSQGILGSPGGNGRHSFVSSSVSSLRSRGRLSIGPNSGGPALARTASDASAPFAYSAPAKASSHQDWQQSPTADHRRRGSDSPRQRFWCTITEITPDETGVICSSCNEAPPDTYCHDCGVVYCNQCLHSSHRLGKLASHDVGTIYRPGSVTNRSCASCNERLRLMRDVMQERLSSETGVRLERRETDEGPISVVMSVRPQQTTTFTTEKSGNRSATVSELRRRPSEDNASKRVPAVSSSPSLDGVQSYSESPRGSMVPASGVPMHFTEDEFTSRGSLGDYRMSLNSFTSSTSSNHSFTSCGSTATTPINESSLAQHGSLPGSGTSSAAGTPSSASAISVSPSASTMQANVMTPGKSSLTEHEGRTNTSRLRISVQAPNTSSMRRLRPVDRFFNQQGRGSRDSPRARRGSLSESNHIFSDKTPAAPQQPSPLSNSTSGQLSSGPFSPGPHGPLTPSSASLKTALQHPARSFQHHGARAALAAENLRVNLSTATIVSSTSFSAGSPNSSSPATHARQYRKAAAVVNAQGEVVTPSPPPAYQGPNSNKTSPVHVQLSVTQMPQPTVALAVAPTESVHRPGSAAAIASSGPTGAQDPAGKSPRKAAAGNADPALTDPAANSATGSTTVALETAKTQNANARPTGGRRRKPLPVAQLALDLGKDEDVPVVAQSFNFSAEGTLQTHGFEIKVDGIKQAPHGHSAPERPGELIGMRDLLIMLEELGQGAGGKVYKALYVKTLRLVAVKVIRVLDKEKRHQIIRELKSLYNNFINITDTVYEDSTCPSLVAFYDAYTDPDTMSVSIILEYMDAGSLEDLVQTNHRCSERTLANIAYKVLTGLAHLHEKHQLHRDIKPSNILINKSGSVKISDFGISRELEDTKALATTFTGTLLYMAPERISGGDYSYPSDIWSFGLSLMACAIGKNPIATDHGYWGIVDAVRSQPSPSLAEFGEFSPELVHFVGQCLQKDPSGRPSAKQLLQHPFILQKYRPCAPQEPSMDDVAPEDLEGLDELVRKVASWHEGHQGVGVGLPFSRATGDGSPTTKNIRIASKRVAGLAEQLGLPKQVVIDRFKQDFQIN